MDNFYQLTSTKINNKLGLITKYINKRNHFVSGKYNKIENPIETNKIEAKDINKDNINRISSNQKMIKKEMQVLIY